MLGPLDPEVRHLAFDHPRVGPTSTVGQQFEEQLVSELLGGGTEDLRGKNPGETPWTGVPPGGCG